MSVGYDTAAPGSDVSGSRLFDCALLFVWLVSIVSGVLLCSFQLVVACRAFFAFHLLSRHDERCSSCGYPCALHMSQALSLVMMILHLPPILVSVLVLIGTPTAATSP